jgi:ubiquinone/menaquinone biosynthesis C-methylase UbiE
MSNDARKEQIVRTYDLASDTYDGEWLPFWRASAEALVQHLGIRPGDRVLDLGTGTGEGALSAAHRVGPTGRVVGIDLAEAMLQQARQKVAQLDYRHVELRLHDMEDLDAIEGEFDFVLSSFTLFFAADMHAVLRGAAGRLRAGGQVAVASPGRACFQPHSDLLMNRLRRLGARVPERLSWQRIADAAALEELLVGAGLSEVRSETIQLGYRIPGPAAWWELVWGSGFRGPVSQLEGAALDAFRRAHLDEIDALGEAGRWLELPTHLGFGRRS